MLFWLFVILIAVGVLIICIPGFCDKFKREGSSNIILDFICDVADVFLIEFGIAITVISVVVAFAMLIIIIAFHVTHTANFEKNQERYMALTYKAESDSYRDEFGLLNKEVIDEIQEWNEDLAFNKSNQRDFWIGIFIPNIYDDFEKIDYEKF